MKPYLYFAAAIALTCLPNRWYLLAAFQWAAVGVIAIHGRAYRRGHRHGYRDGARAAFESMMVVEVDQRPCQCAECVASREKVGVN